MKGSLTVEASYIFPFCFLVIGLVCYLGIYSYNLSVLKMTGYESIIEIINTPETDDDLLAEMLTQNALRRAEERIMSVNDLNTEIQITATKIILKYNGTQTILDLSLDVTVVYEKTFPEAALRLIK